MNNPSRAGKTGWRAYSMPLVRLSVIRRTSAERSVD